MIGYRPLRYPFIPYSINIFSWFVSKTTKKLFFRIIAPGHTFSCEGAPQLYFISLIECSYTSAWSDMDFFYFRFYHLIGRVVKQRRASQQTVVCTSRNYFLEGLWDLKKSWISTSGRHLAASSSITSQTKSSSLLSAGSRFVVLVIFIPNNVILGLVYMDDYKRRIQFWFKLQCRIADCWSQFPLSFLYWILIALPPIFSLNIAK